MPLRNLLLKPPQPPQTLATRRARVIQDDGFFPPKLGQIVIIPFLNSCFYKNNTAPSIYLVKNIRCRGVAVLETNKYFAKILLAIAEEIYV